MSETRISSDNRHAFVPAIDDIIAPPPLPVDTGTKPEPKQDVSMGFIVVTANVFVAAIIVIGMLVDGKQASQAIITGSLYFAITTVVYALLHTGTLSAIVGVWQREGTERLRIRTYADVAEMAINWRIRIEDNRRLELEVQSLPAQLSRRLATLESEIIAQRVNADPPQSLSAFVAPYDNTSRAAHAETTPQVDTTANEAISWLNGLYDDYGNADMSKVGSDGRLKIRMLGSSRGPGSREAGLWLIQKNVINKVPGGFALNLRHFRTREAVRNLL